MNLNQKDFIEGKLLLIKKPINWTSFQIVNKIRWLIKMKFNLKKIKVGHAGTLDPLATGLLIICTGKLTKKIIDFQNLNKSYKGTFVIGATTPSFDLETKVSSNVSIDKIKNDYLFKTSKKFLGRINQEPPLFSAIKINGKKLYDYARKNENIKIPKREIIISKFELTKINLPEIDFEIDCSKGTYIRSVANDFGKEIKVGAYLKSLCRTSIGNYNIKNAISIKTFEKFIKN
tara:strand:- start:106 stop:801 length:696 start_codon:yes stop_codon:yes gene_type:complete